jgi:hypothetical protein
MPTIHASILEMCIQTVTLRFVPFHFVPGHFVPVILSHAHLVPGHFVPWSFRLLLSHHLLPFHMSKIIKEEVAPPVN